MRASKILAYGVVLCVAASTARGVVRVVVKNGKTLIYNDGIAEGSAARQAASASWSAAQVAARSRFDTLIIAAARDHALDPKLLKSVMLFESGFNPKAVSRKGARGLMQLMPRTARLHGVQNVHDPQQNVQAGARHLAYLLELYRGDLEKTLAAYNAGEAAVERYGGIPPFDETRDYVRNILWAYEGRADLRGGFGQPSQKTMRPGRPVKVVRDTNNRLLLTTSGTAAPRPLS